MSKIKWDQAGERLFELGIDQGVLYRHGSDPSTQQYTEAYAWNGLTSVNEAPTGGEPNDQYADNLKYVTLIGKENFAGTINAYTYPEAFSACDGTAAAATGLYISGQTREPFGLSYRTKVGNDTVGENFGYKLHLCYGLRCSPSDKSRETINESPEAAEFSWDFTSTPVAIETKKADGSLYEPTAHIVIDSTKLTSTAGKAALKSLEDILYGTDPDTEAQTPGTAGYLPTIDYVLNLFKYVA